MSLHLAARARIAIAGIYFVNGSGLGLWAGHIPLIRRGLALTEGELGIALLAMAAGAMLLMPCMGWVVHRLGSSRCAVAGAVAFALALLLPLLAPSFWPLVGATFVLGAANGALDVAQSTHAAAVERALGEPVLSSVNGFFSLGAMLGAGLASVMLGAGLEPLLGVGLAAAALAAIALLGGRWLLADDPWTGGDEGQHFRLPTGVVLALGVLALLGVVGEGAMLDWSGVYLADVLDASTATAPLGFAAFAATMTIGRLGGDAMVKRLGPQRVLLWSGVGAALGLGGVTLAPTPMLALPAFALTGLGMANLFPLMISAAARLPGIAPAAAVAAVATLAYTGGLLGPVVIGFGAEAFGLRLALAGLLAAPLAILAAALGGWVRLAPVATRAGTA